MFTDKAIFAVIYACQSNLQLLLNTIQLSNIIVSRGSIHRENRTFIWFGCIFLDMNTNITGLSVGDEETCLNWLKTTNNDYVIVNR